jgi:hypothetical protein
MIGGAVAWCTAQVFIGLSRFRKLLKGLISSSILTEFRGQANDKLSGNSRDWNNLMDADLELAGVKTSLKDEIFSRILNPLVCKEGNILAALTGKQETVISEASAVYNPPIYSAILFGPPGTAKTTICTSMASYLGWNFLTIDTACFLSEGNFLIYTVYLYGLYVNFYYLIIMFRFTTDCFKDELHFQ